MASLLKKARNYDQNQAPASNEFKFDNPQPLKVKSGPRPNIVNESDMFNQSNQGTMNYSNRRPEPIPMNSDSLPSSGYNTREFKKQPEGVKFGGDDDITSADFLTPKVTDLQNNFRNFEGAQSGNDYQGTSYHGVNPQDLADKIINEDLPKMLSNFDIGTLSNEDSQFSREFQMLRRLASKLEYDIESEI